MIVKMLVAVGCVALLGGVASAANLLDILAVPTSISADGSSQSTLTIYLRAEPPIAGDVEVSIRLMFNLLLNRYLDIHHTKCRPLPTPLYVRYARIGLKLFRQGYTRILIRISTSGKILCMRAFTGLYNT